MVKHMIIWKVKEELDEKKTRVAAVKEALEGLVGQIDGLLEMHILTEGLSSSSGDVMMDSVFADANALAAYQTHPLHVQVANGLVRPIMEQRLSFDYEA